MHKHAALAALALCASACISQKDLLDAARGAGKRAVGDATNESYDAAKGGLKGAVKNGSNAPASGAGAETTTSSSAGVPSASSPPETPTAGEVYGNEYDFVAGEKLVFFDDFSGTDAGDYPLKWTTKGGGGAPTEVVESGGKRWLKMRSEKSSSSESLNWVRLDVKNDLPQKFTVEFDCYSTGEYYLTMIPTGHGGGRVYIGPNSVELAHSKIERQAAPNRVQHVAVSVSGTYLKVYVDGRRLAQDPDAIARPIQHLGFSFYNYYQYKTPRQYDMMTSFRVAEGGKDYATDLTTAGRIVTHGITFDTGSDVLKPESGPTLRNILKLLQDSAELRFEIQGHTDNVGGDKVNGPLSAKRAAAVKTWLVNQGIAAARLTTKGLGSSKPIDSNGTPEGRANNRRVEFVKLGAGTS